jgi:hypothetical protein
VFYELFRSLLQNSLFNDNLQNDPDSKYFVFFTDDNAGDNLGRDFGTTQSILIQNTALAPRTVSAQPSIGFDYDYDGNIQRGGSSAGTNAPFTAVAPICTICVTTGSITRSTANVINFVAALKEIILHNLKFK